MSLFNKLIVILSVITVIITIAILTKGLILGLISFEKAFEFILVDFILMLLIYLICLK